MATSIADKIGDEHPREIIATTLVAFALSSILTGIRYSFFALVKASNVTVTRNFLSLTGCVEVGRLDWVLPSSYFGWAS